MNDLQPTGVEVSDAELAARIQRGLDPNDNFRELFRRHHGGVRHFFLRKGLAHEDCRDLTQETFFRVYRYIEAFYGGDFKVWLFCIALNVYRNEIRRRNADKRRGGEVPLPEAAAESRESPGPGEETVAPDPQPEAEMLSREHRRAVLLCLEAMPSQMRRCVKLRIWGHEVRQIARILDRTPNTVKVHLHRARKRLQEELGQHFGEAGF